MRHQDILDVTKEINEGLPSSEFLVITLLDDVGFMECDEEPSLFLVHAKNAFVRHKNSVLYVQPFFNLLFHYSIGYERGTSIMEASQGGPGPSSFEPNFLR